MKPKFGEWVRFTHHMEKRTHEEFQALIDAEEGVIYPKISPNPEPDAPAMVIGLVSKAVMHQMTEDDEGERQRYVAVYGHNRSFYVLRRTNRGKRFLVPIDALIRGEENGS